MSNAPKEFKLKYPFEVMEHGTTKEFTFLEIKRPTGINRTACFQLKSQYGKAKSAFTEKLLANMSEDDIEKIQDERAKQKEEEEIPQDSGNTDGVSAILNSGDVDLDVCNNAMFAILKTTGNWNSEHAFKPAHVETMDMEDLDELLVFYLANFM